MSGQSDRDELSGQTKNLVLHLTRHEHATAIRDQFGDFAASKALGHANIKTSMRYAKANERPLRERQDAV